MNYTGRCFRGHDPKWSFSPTSGEGARITGGRFNPPGQAVLYLATTIDTAIGECMQGFANRLLPLTICGYDVDCDLVADLSDEAGRAALGVALNDLACPWKTLMDDGAPVPSWGVAESIRARGHRGMLVPSFFVGATARHINLILWEWSNDPPSMVRVFDPTGRLPRDQQSWA